MVLNVTLAPLEPEKYSPYGDDGKPVPVKTEFVIETWNPYELVNGTMGEFSRRCSPDASLAQQQHLIATIMRDLVWVEKARMKEREALEQKGKVR